jgi:hypothetical protein
MNDAYDPPSPLRGFGAQPSPGFANRSSRFGRLVSEGW